MTLSYKHIKTSRDAEVLDMHDIDIVYLCFVILYAHASPVGVQQLEMVCTLTQSKSRSSSLGHSRQDFLFLVHLDFHTFGKPAHNNRGNSWYNQE